MGRPGGPPYCGVRYNTSVNMRTPAGALFATVVLGAAPAFAASCESLTSLSLPETTITLAQPVAAGTFTVPGAAGGKGKQGPSYRDLPAFCRVTATIKPTSDSDIQNRSVDARADELERQTGGQRERRLDRFDQSRDAGRSDCGAATPRP